MLSNKKILATAIAMASNAVFSGTMGSACTPGSITTPCGQKTWSFASKALYLQDSAGGLDFPGYAEVGNAQNNVRTYDNRGNNWNWGFEIEAAYEYSTGKDININWYRIDQNSKGTAPVPLFTASGALFRAPYIQRKPHWDAVNLEFGQQINLTEQSYARIHGGAEYVYLSETLKINSTGINPTDYVDSKRNPSFSGGGPRLGADLFYNLSNRFSVYAKGATGIYVGTAKLYRLFVLLNGNTSEVRSSHQLIVPEIEGKLGATYTHAMASGNLSLDGGWMLVNYFQALTRIPSSIVIDTNIGFQGPYFGLKWQGNIA